MSKTSEIAHSMMPDSDFVFQLPEDVLNHMQSLPQLKESPSSITKFLECPLKWVGERYISFPLLEGQEIIQANPWNVLGTFLHRVFEVFYNEYPEDRTERLLKDLYRKCLNELESGGRSGLVEQSLIRDYEWVMTYIAQKKAPRYWPWDFKKWMREESKKMVFNIYEFEEPEDVDVISNEKWARIIVNNVLIRMKIDREVQSEGGQLIVDDWKTGKNPPVDDEDGIEITNLHFFPGAIYGYVDKTRQHDHVNRVRLLHVKTGDKFVIKMTPERREVVKEVLNLTTKAMNYVRETGEIVANPGKDNESGACTYCPIKDWCPVFSDELDQWRSLRERAQIGEYSVKEDDE